MTFAKVILKYDVAAPREFAGERALTIEEPKLVAQLASFFPRAFDGSRSKSDLFSPLYRLAFVEADTGSVTYVGVRPDCRAYLAHGEWEMDPSFGNLAEGLLRANRESQPPTRYNRQTLLPQIGRAGERRLGQARVLLIGCGALGTMIADQLVRAGVGFLRIVDRDVVELTNLQRQVLFDEADARDGSPKAVAAARRLSAVNSQVIVEPVVADVHAGNIQELAGVDDRYDATGLRTAGRAMHLILDGTDNAETRYLINDLSVKHHISWVYGACVGVEGRVMPIRTYQPCLRCLFPDPPSPGELPTCDTVGVLGPAAAVVAATQAAIAIQLLATGDAPRELLRFDLWRARFGATPLDDARRPDCPCCGQHRFDFLDAPGGGAGSAISLCGRNAVQIRPASGTRLDLAALATRLTGVADVQQTPHLLRCSVPDHPGVQLTVFADGRAIVQGVNDFARARSLYARWIGT